MIESIYVSDIIALKLTYVFSNTSIFEANEKKKSFIKLLFFLTSIEVSCMVM